MSVTRESFGFMPDGTEIYKYILENGKGTQAHVLTLGATLQSFITSDKNGEMRDVLLGFDTVEDYLSKSNYQGATVGRYANRIGGASFEINGREYKLTPNEKNVTSLHSAGDFSYNAWKAIVPDADMVEMSYFSPDGSNGFPGNVDVKVVFRLTEDNKLSIKYRGISDKDTYLNFTNHSYFNLNGYSSGDVLSHYLKIDSPFITPVDELSIPQGDPMSVEGTPFDFRKFTKIGDRIEDDHVQLKMTGGYDHNYCLSDSQVPLREVAQSYSEDSVIKMKVLTTLTGKQFYAGNFLKGAEGKNGKPMEKRSGFCLETQFFPDTPHRPDFPSCLFKAGEEYSSETVFAFSCEQE
ncbi:MAG: galactose mutarotase [Clostridia bacterium]|nr:galactose mutarotase [Clostridia bacterium]